MIEEIIIPVTSKSFIHGVLQYSKITKDRPFVLFIHGLTSSNSGYVEIGNRLLLESDISSLCISLRGHGQSSGEFDKLTFNDSFEDTMAAIHYAYHQTGISISSFGIQGTSIGAALGTLALTKVKVDSLILRVPAVYTSTMRSIPYTEIMSREAAWFQELEPKETPQIKAIGNYHNSLLVIRSENDSVIPEKITDAYVESCPSLEKKLVNISGASHNLTDRKWRDEYINLTCDWFGKTLF